jgi:hypothetical protein
MSTLNVITSTVGFDDATASNNPQRRSPDWRRSFPGMPADMVAGVPFTVDPLQEVSLFSGARSLTANSSTDYDLENVPVLGTSRYRLTWGGAGTAPGFRTARTLALSGGNLVVTYQANQTVTLSSNLGAVFGALQVGDDVFLPGTSTGDTGPFDPLNEGLWTVLVAGASGVTLGRPDGTVFSGATETVAVADDAEVQAFSVLGVQIGDTVDISSGFSASAQRAYEIVSVTATRIEFVSTTPLGDETAVPGTSGLAIYSAAKFFVQIEADQECALKYNGATGNGCRLTPRVASDQDHVGFDLKMGTVYSLSVKNLSTRRLNGRFIWAT